MLQLLSHSVGTRAHGLQFRNWMDHLGAIGRQLLDAGCMAASLLKWMHE